eukprot:scaffold102782_cov23-Tisochrysis_lutea.AAC.1
MQRNEGQWDFSMEEGADGRCLVLEVDIGKYIDTSLIKADIQPGYIRWGSILVGGCIRCASILTTLAAVFCAISVLYANYEAQVLLVAGPNPSKNVNPLKLLADKAHMPADSWDISIKAVAAVAA